MMRSLLHQIGRALLVAPIIIVVAAGMELPGFILGLIVGAG